MDIKIKLELDRSDYAENNSGLENHKSFYFNGKSTQIN